MRLIDADELINWICNDSGDNLMDEYYIEHINNMPEAYDVDKVVEQLEEAKGKIASEDYCKNMNDKESCLHKDCYKCCAEYLIEIVKGGGVDVN